MPTCRTCPETELAPVSHTTFLSFFFLNCNSLGPLYFFFSFYRYWFRSNLSITPGSANLEILINKKTTTKNKKTKNKHKNHWLNFCLNKKCPKLLCGLGIGHRRRQTIPMRNSSGGKGILQGITVCLVSAVLSTV